MKLKDRKVDILLVVNMFLTGFDSKRLNTMYVDKILRFHGMIQAYSRTNSILNEVKADGTKEKASILDDVDFELELIHKGVINVQYILKLLAQLYEGEQKELRSKQELIEKFIEQKAVKTTYFSPCTYSTPTKINRTLKQRRNSSPAQSA